MNKEELVKELERLEINIQNGSLPDVGQMVGHLVNLSYAKMDDGDLSKEDLHAEIQTVIDEINPNLNDMSGDSSSEDYELGYLHAVHDMLKAFNESRFLDK